MMASYVLTFHRAENTAEPEGFAFEPQVYKRFEGDQPVKEASFPWTIELLALPAKPFLLQMRQEVCTSSNYETRRAAPPEPRH